MTNENCLIGWKCPRCRHTKSFRVEAVRPLTVLLTDDGTDDQGGDTTWEDASTAFCCNCQHKAAVFDFTHVNEIACDKFRGYQQTMQELESLIQSVTSELDREKLRVVRQLGGYEGAADGNPIAIALVLADAIANKQELQKLIIALDAP